jgi:Tfp pilus assembly protein PilF
MVLKRQQFIILILFAVLVSLIGCQRQQRDPAGARTNKEIQRTAAEIERSKLRKRIDRKYSDSEAHFELGELYLQDGLWLQAEQEFKTSLNFDPSHRRSQAGRIKALLNAGDKRVAEILADEYIQRASDSPLASLELALGFQSQSLDDYALTCYQQGLRLAPNSAKINRQIGFYYMSKGDKVRAQEYLTRSFNLNPNQSDVALQLGKMGIQVRIPQKKPGGTKKLDRTVDEFDRELLK